MWYKDELAYAEVAIGEKSSASSSGRGCGAGVIPRSHRLVEVAVGLLSLFHYAASPGRVAGLDNMGQC